MTGMLANEKLTKRRKRFLLHKGILKDIARKSKERGLSKNAYLQQAIQTAFKQYASENLFIFTAMQKEIQQ